MSNHTGVEIAWKNFEVKGPLTKTEKKKRKMSGLPIDDKTIIRNANGIISAGTFTAILGPSGSGKTTLLNFLANRIYYLKGLKVSGEVYINGHSRSDIDFNSIAGYVMQDDVIMETMTVEEVLTFTAKLRLPKETWKEKVDKVINSLELHNCKHSRVGGVLKKGISGGEKKRVSIGIEMLIDPAILFLDEPTTGLDSYNSENLVKNMRNLSKTGITVICTIHQPNSFIYANFENVLLLGGGNTAFHGDAQQAILHFNNLGYPCPKFSNPAEHLLALLSPIDDTFNERMEAFRKSFNSEVTELEEKEISHIFKAKESTVWEELWMLGQRIIKNFVRNRMILLFKIIGNTVFILLTLMAFFDICSGTNATSVMNRAGVIFFILVFLSFMAVNASGAYADEKAMFIREQASKTYKPVSYFFSKLFFEAPFDLTIRVIVIFCIYLGVGLSLANPEQIFIFVGIVILVELCARGWGTFLVISIPDLQAASAAAPFLMIIQLLFAGFFINYDNIPVYLIWLEYMSMFKYSWSAALENEFNTWDQAKCGQAVLCDPIDYFSIIISLGINIVILACLVVAINFLAFLALLNLSRKFRL
ncbi:unnamed protein product [Blepharisma stoltei]|uniref:ABC transporter domain-containing protein n=1 Tax=Blepharisma stoltei TaxID=1481888 RepID=A0AAU9JJL1_9CILI|nr:unnamed protein product [Blepharisma stoltei]